MNHRDLSSRRVPEPIRWELREYLCHDDGTGSLVRFLGSYDTEAQAEASRQSVIAVHPDPETFIRTPGRRLVVTSTGA